MRIIKSIVFKILAIFFRFKTILLAKNTKGWKLYYSKKLDLLCLINLDNYIDFLIYNQGIYNEPLIQAIDKIINSSNINMFFDIGANIGQMSLYVKKHFPNIKVYSFEPILANNIQHEAQMLINNLSYTIEKCAISDYNERLLLYEPKKNNKSADYGKYNPGMYSIFCDEFRNPNEIIEVPACSFDEIVTKYQIGDAPVLIKIDVEGAELKVLKGMTTFFSKRTKTSLVMELNINNNPIYQEAVNYMCSLGFLIYDIHLRRIDPQKIIYDGDYIFANYDILSQFR